MHAIALLMACTGATPVDTDLPDDTDVAVDTSPPKPTVILWADDPEVEPASLWVDWFSARWSTEAHGWDERHVSVPDDALVVFLPDLPQSAATDASKHAKGAAILGLGVGGANAYEGLDNGLGVRNGMQGEIDGLTVAAGHESDLIFAEIAVPEGGVVTITTQPITDVGIRPADSIEVVAWDSRFPGTYADIAYSGRAWYWGWGDAKVGGPPVYTDDGLAILGSIVGGLVPRR
jgi:hypothetical protein